MPSPPSSGLQPAVYGGKSINVKPAPSVKLGVQLNIIVQIWLPSAQ